MINAYSKTEKNNMIETLEDFYSDYLPLMKKAIKKVLICIESERDSEKGINNRESNEHIKSRIKSPESMRNKLERKRQKANAENAITKVQDACGIRVVCTFLNDVFDVVDTLL
jgi:putative GTP pyrophosphokinase